MNPINDDIFIYPTDTVWGIGCSIYSESGLRKIATIKKTKFDKPLSIMYCQLSAMLRDFEFPLGLSIDWLHDFFLLETTLGLKKNSARIPLPPWASSGSEFVSLRCLENQITKKICEQTRAPFFTTSLNISGEPPIISSQEAIDFHSKFAPEAKLILNKGNDYLSGSSSTIVFFSEDASYKLIRVGKNIEVVKKHLEKLS